LPLPGHGELLKRLRVLVGAILLRAESAGAKPRDQP
jgi:hypothetical protein